MSTITEDIAVKPGQTTFPLALQAIPNSLRVAVNGQIQRVTKDFAMQYIIGRVYAVSWVSTDFSLASGDTLNLYYQA